MTQGSDFQVRRPDEKGPFADRPELASGRFPPRRAAFTAAAQLKIATATESTRPPTTHRSVVNSNALRIHVFFPDRIVAENSRLGSELIRPVKRPAKATYESFRDRGSSGTSGKTRGSTILPDRFSSALDSISSSEGSSVLIHCSTSLTVSSSNR